MPMSMSLDHAIRQVLQETPTVIDNAEVNRKKTFSPQFSAAVEQLNNYYPVSNPTSSEHQQRNRVWDETIQKLTQEELYKLLYSMMAYKNSTSSDPLIRGGNNLVKSLCFAYIKDKLNFDPRIFDSAKSVQPPQLQVFISLMKNQHVPKTASSLMQTLIHANRKIL